GGGLRLPLHQPRQQLPRLFAAALLPLASRSHAARAGLNSWMNNPQYLAQVGHSFGAAFVMVVAGLFGGMFAAWIALPIIVVAALIKEFWYDATYELPKQTFS